MSSTTPRQPQAHLVELEKAAEKQRARESSAGSFPAIAAKARGARVGGVMTARHRGVFKVGWVFTFAAAAYNLVRMRNLLPKPVHSA
jgi:hypothetical protein